VRRRTAEIVRIQDPPGEVRVVPINPPMDATPTGIETAISLVATVVVSEIDLGTLPSIDGPTTAKLAVAESLARRRDRLRKR
jgi:hypothetical protein